MDNRVDRLIEYVKGIHKGLDGRQLYLKYREDIEKVKPQEAFEIFYSLLLEGTEAKEILEFLDKVINVFYKSLSSYKWEAPKEYKFLSELILENKALQKRTDKIKGLLLGGHSSNQIKDTLLTMVKELQEINHHYLKKENILFPYLEKTMEKYKGLSIMWALHDEVKEKIKKTIDLLTKENIEEVELNQSMGNLFFAILGVLKKEELILFPSAVETLSPDDWQDMYQQGLEYQLSFLGERKEKEETVKKDSFDTLEYSHNIFKTETGSLTFQQMLMIFNALPVDLTFVDEHNKVRFFTRPKERIFPRSPAIIGRDVKNCHPPASVHIVEEIITSFRNNEKDSTMFWIQAKDSMILIQYFALRDGKGNYRGTLEVSQDITEIRKLKGEKRIFS